MNIKFAKCTNSRYHCLVKVIIYSACQKIPPPPSGNLEVHYVFTTVILNLMNPIHILFSLDPL